jgi:hypothetical protein
MPNKLRYSRQTHSTRCALRIGCKRRKSRTCLMGMCPGLPQPIRTLRPPSVYSGRNRGAHWSSGFSLFRARGRAAVCAWHEIRQRCVALRGCVCVRNLSTIVERLMMTSGEYGLAAGAGQRGPPAIGLDTGSALVRVPGCDEPDVVDRREEHAQCRCHGACNSHVASARHIRRGRAYPSLGSVRIRSCHGTFRPSDRLDRAVGPALATGRRCSACNRCSALVEQQPQDCVRMKCAVINAAEPWVAQSRNGSLSCSAPAARPRCR